MAFTYKGMTPEVGVIAYPITPNNVPPLLVLWLLVTTNQNFFDPDMGDTLSAAARLEIATRLGVTPATVDFVLTTVADANLLPAFRKAATAFSSIGQAGNYGDPFCPNSYEQILSLAPSAQVADPSK